MRKTKQIKKGIVSAYVTADTKAKLVKRAKKAKSKSFSSYIAELLEKEIAKNEKGE